MTEPTGTPSAEPGDDWLTATGGDAIASPAVVSTGPTTDATRRGVLTRAGLIAAGGVIGALVVTTLHHGSSANTASATANTAGSLPGTGALGGQQGLPGQPPAGAGGGFAPGGRSGEQHLAGTLTRIGPSSVTVRSTGGTATYTVTSDTQIIRNGAPATLAALRVGDAVFVHVYPTGSGSRLTVERLFAGSSALDDGPGGGGAPGPGRTGTTTTRET